MKLSIETLFKDLCMLPKEGLYCLINEEDKKIQIYNTVNIISSISRLSQEIENLNNSELKKDLDKVKLKILETNFKCKDSRNIRYKQVIQSYKDRGYKFYNELSVVQYIVKETFQYKDLKAYYVIELVNPSSRINIVVGVFRKYREARKFLKDYYPDNTIPKITIAENEDTKLWLSKT